MIIVEENAHAKFNYAISFPFYRLFQRFFKQIIKKTIEWNVVEEIYVIHFLSIFIFVWSLARYSDHTQARLLCTANASALVTLTSSFFPRISKCFSILPTKETHAIARMSKQLYIASRPSNTSRLKLMTHPTYSENNNSEEFYYHEKNISKLLHFSSFWTLTCLVFDT